MVILIGIVLIGYVIAWLLTELIILFLNRSKSLRSVQLQGFLKVDSIYGSGYYFQELFLFDCAITDGQCNI